eukprot:Anaeramoba_flamelloidesa568333_204.p1 GENE.a568333_204~~a568333_204.p1  ORF type:complete len:679 (-),score=76.83 a568333_204:285-2321(-)
MKKVLSIAMVLLAAITLFACTPEEEEETVTLDVAINYKGNMTITSHLDSPYMALNGETYNPGDLLPTWEAIAEVLDVDFNDIATESDGDTNAQFERLQTNSFAGVDIINATGAQIGPEGVAGNFVDLSEHLSDMPNFSAFLDDNPAVEQSITSADDGIYFTPYFDGFGEQELMFLMRIDWVEDILDTDSPTFDTTAAVVPDSYTNRVITTPIDVDITVANSDGTTRVVEKDYANNILDTLAGLTDPTGADVANAFITHMEDTYGDQGYTKLSDVFVGTDAAYDTDELLALMYVVKSNPGFLTADHTDGAKTSVEVFFPRESKGSRIRNLFRGLEMFGVRGVVSRAEWLYIDETGTLNDARHDQEFIDAVNHLSDMYSDGLILQNPEEPAGSNWRTQLLSSSTGFMSYDYNASSTSQGLIDAGSAIDSDYKYQAVLPPVVDWLGDGTYFHYSESVRSVKNEAWGIPIGVADDEAKLAKAIALFDGMYDYSAADSIGTIGLYGPVGWTDGTMSYADQTVYRMSEDALDEMNTLAGGNMINYLRQYVGATLPIGHVRSLGLEFQTLSSDGEEGVSRLNTARSAGVLKLAGQVDSTNPWYSITPTFFPLTEAQSDEINDTTTAWRDIYSDNALITMVKYGFSGAGESVTEAEYWDLFIHNETIDSYDDVYINYYRQAYALVS